MKKRWIRPWLALSILMTASGAGAQGGPGAHIGLAGGAVFPTQDAKDVYRTGYHASLLFAFHAPIAPLGIRIEGTYGKLDGKLDFPDLTADDVRVVSGTANLILGPRHSLVRPYFIGGAGIYNLRFRGDVFTGNFDESQTKFGWNAGAGISIPIGPASTMFLEARYNRVDTDPNPFLRDRFTFVPLTFGLVF